MSKENTNTTKKSTTRTTRASAATRQNMDTNIQAWLDSNKTRPKTVVLTLNRTNSGYTIQEAVILNRTNQHVVEPVLVSSTAIATDINRRGIRA